MTAEVHSPELHAAQPPPSEAVATLVEHYPMVLIVDAVSERIEWMSEAWLRRTAPPRSIIGCQLRDVIGHLPKPEQTLPIASRLRDQGIVHHAPVELGTEGGALELHDLSVLPLDLSGSVPRLAIIARRVASAVQEAPSGDLLDSLPVAVIGIGSDGYLTRWNRAAETLTGASAEALRACPAAALAADVTSLSRLLPALGTRERTEIELLVRRTGASAQPVRAQITPHTDAEGRPAGVVVMLEESRATTDVALEQRNAELEHCINSLAHDLRSPLVALLGFSRLLREDYGARLDETGAHFVDRIEQAGQTMEGLIHDLLELSRIGQPGEHPALIDPHSVLVQLAAEFKTRLETESISLVLPDAPPPIYCDRTRLYQVFCNLIGNAIDHMGDAAGRRIEVEVRNADGFHHVCVRDDGRGVAPEQHEKIFEPFQSLGARRDGRKGTGMGLAIVRKIAETRGGRAWVESTPGQGAAFHATFAEQ